MSQRVNVQYSIDLDELPSEINRLVEKVGLPLSDAQLTYQELRTLDPVSVNALQYVDDLRLLLARVDYALDDVSKIIRGYMQLSTQKPNQQPQETQQQAPPTPWVPSGDSLGNLEEKLRAFSESMSDEQSPQVTDSQ
tara:strand:- start:238 stop:648 length:411 start_codon:yes stop_codon:yes gene_type:complete